MRRRRGLWIILLAAPLVLVAADTVYWEFAVRRLEEGFAAWLAQQRAAGWTEVHQAPVRGGWPLAATLTVTDVTLQGGEPDIPGGLAWSAETVVLRVALPQPGVLDVVPAGRQRLRIAGSPDITYVADRLRLVVPLDAAPWPRFVDLAADNLHADTPLGGDAGAGSLRLRLDIRPEARTGEPLITFALKASSITPPSGVVRPLGPRIPAFAADGALNGPMPAGHSLADRAAAWRDGGGSLELRHLTLGWGPLDLNASATLALDEQLQPMGAGNARVIGYAETLDALASHAAISRSAATAAKAVLSLLANSPDDGSPPDVEVPLTLQYRTLSMRQVPLVRLPELDWP